MSGIEVAPSIESRLQRLFRATTEYLGRCPRLYIDDAPLALNANRPGASELTSAKGTVSLQAWGDAPRDGKK
jgi:hypothetical protein